MSSRFDENDALVYCDDVKVPWERMFVLEDTDTARAQFQDTYAHYMNYQAMTRLMVKMKFQVGVARRICETIGTVGMPGGKAGSHGGAGRHGRAGLRRGIRWRHV